MLFLCLACEHVDVLIFGISGCGDKGESFAEKQYLCFGKCDVREVDHIFCTFKAGEIGAVLCYVRSQQCFSLFKGFPVGLGCFVGSCCCLCVVVSCAGVTCYGLCVLV